MGRRLTYEVILRLAEKEGDLFFHSHSFVTESYLVLAYVRSQYLKSSGENLQLTRSHKISFRSLQKTDR